MTQINDNAGEWVVYTSVPQGKIEGDLPLFPCDAVNCTLVDGVGNAWYVGVPKSNALEWGDHVWRRIGCDYHGPARVDAALRSWGEMPVPRENAKLLLDYLLSFPISRYLDRQENAQLVALLEQVRTDLQEITRDSN